MKKLKFKEEIRHPVEVKKLREELLKMEYEVSDNDIQKAYSLWSENAWCAGWVNIGVHTNLYYVCRELVKNYFVEVE